VLGVGSLTEAKNHRHSDDRRHHRLPRAAAVSTPNPFTSPAMRALLAGRGGDITAGVYDIDNGRTYLYRPGVREQTASIVKVNILAALLHQDEGRGEPIDADDAATATGMIEASDNDDATQLWDEDGAQTGIATFDRAIGMDATVPGYDWGNTETTAFDQLRLLKYVALPNAVLRSSYREFELNLMTHIEPDEDWGVSSGPPAGVTVALKNGWLPAPGVQWQVNSIGYVHGDGRDYLIAVLTNEDPEETYGIDTIEAISARVWAALPRIVHTVRDGVDGEAASDRGRRA
jgi:beta-lactamase class A